MKNFKLLLFVLLLIAPSIHYGYDLSETSNSTTKDLTSNYNPEEAVMNTSVFFTYSSETELYEDIADGNTTLHVCIGISDPDPTVATSVDVEVSDVGLAQDGMDIETFGVHTVTFPSGQGGEQCLAISVIDDQIAEGHEDLVFNLVNIIGGTDAIVGDSEFGSVLYTNIFDNDNTTVEFSSSSDTEFEENLGVLNLCLSINRPSATEATIAFVETSCEGCGPEYATYGVDYEEPSQLGSLVEITFPAGSTEDQCFVLMALDDTSNEGSELLNLFIADATGGDAVTRVDPLSIIATLLDDESAPTSVFFTNNSGSVIYEDETLGLTEIDVCIGIMEPDPTNATSVDIAISPDGEAIDGIDVEIFAPGTITFPAGSCLLYTSPSPRDQRGSRMPSSA